jgi:hypothetical protein
LDKPTAVAVSPLLAAWPLTVGLKPLGISLGTRRMVEGDGRVHRAAAMRLLSYFPRKLHGIEAADAGRSSNRRRVV